MTKEDRIKIINENKDVAKHFGIIEKRPSVVDFIEFDYLFNHITEEAIGENPSFDKSKVYFENTDTISAARLYKSDNGVDFLVFASEKNYGGGVWKGAKAQEEDIFLSTTLGELKDEVQKKYYPLNGVLTVECDIIRDSSFNELKYSRPARAFIAPAPNMNKKKHVEDIDFWTRMCTLLDSTYENAKGDYIIIGAWGCGVFKNDPTEVAEMFKKVMTLLLEDYKGVVIAIPDTNLLNIFKKVITE